MSRLCDQEMRYEAEMWVQSGIQAKNIRLPDRSARQIINHTRNNQHMFCNDDDLFWIANDSLWVYMLSHFKLIACTTWWWVLAYNPVACGWQRCFSSTEHPTPDLSTCSVTHKGCTYTWELLWVPKEKPWQCSWQGMFSCMRVVWLPENTHVEVPMESRDATIVGSWVSSWIDVILYEGSNTEFLFK